LDSLRRQTLAGWELVCVAPEDTPADILRRLQRFGGKRGRLVTVPANTPFTEQRNAGLAAAKGKYAAFLHSKNRFTPRFLSGLLQTAEKENATLVVGRQRSFGALGRHDFTSADALSLHRSIRCTDFRLLWNPSVSNKLYRLEDIRRLDLHFMEDFGYAADALFTLTFAFATQAVASARKGFSEWREEPFEDSLPTQAELASYISAYGQIKRQAEEYFDGEIANALGDFPRREAKRARAAYLDQVRGKLLTVLLYRFYRRFYNITPELLSTATRAVLHEYEMLSNSGKAILRRAHADILLGGDLPTSIEEAADTRKVTILLCGERTADELAAQLESLGAQTLPFFELLCDERLEPLFPADLTDPRLRFLSVPETRPGERQAAIKQAALEQAGTRYLLILERPARLDPKALQRHWHAIKKEPDAGFTTAPYSRFDGERVGQYASAQLYFDSGSLTAGRERMEQAPDYPLDLLWENKLLRLRHLQGVRFTFSADSALDCCRLYQNASFVRLPETALYLTLTQDELLAALRREGALLPPELRVKTRCLHMRSTLMSFRRRSTAISRRAQFISALPGNFFLHMMRAMFHRLPLRNETLFYTARPASSYTTSRHTERNQHAARKDSRALPEDLRLVYERLDGQKRVFAAALPHSLWQRTVGFLHLMTTRIIITDGTVPDLAEFRLRGDQRVLQIWHACGAYKRFALDAPLSRPRSAEEKAHAQYTAAIVSGEECRDFAAHAFNLEPERVLPLGSPHTDTLLDADAMQARRERMLHNHPVLRGKKVYVYCPTSRAGVFDPKIRWKKLSQSLEQDEIFVIHRHPLSRETYIAGQHYRRVRDYTNEPLADMLSVCDVLVTDYSAVVQEASLLGKPVLFYCPDWEDYEREFYLSFPDDLPGVLATDWVDLPEALRKTLAQPRTDKLSAFRKRQMGACDGHSTERVVDLMNRWVADKE
jgi:CDP-glycerol glycerophosphotransferase (TagB/SpsB family)/glycosyltransferase involved in cell wall biosynthesis